MTNPRRRPSLASCFGTIGFELVPFETSFPRGRRKHTGVSRAAKKHGAGREIPRELETIQEQLEQKTAPWLDMARFAPAKPEVPELRSPSQTILRFRFSIGSGQEDGNEGLTLIWEGSQQNP